MGRLTIYGRWLLVPVCGLLGFYAAMFLAIGADGLLNGWCPGGEIVSGACSLPWISHATMAVGVLAAPLFAGGAAVWAAPKRTPAVIWTIFGLGALGAIPFARASPGYTLAALVWGAVMARLLQRRFCSKMECC